jgi:hypothetical protein
LAAAGTYCGTAVVLNTAVHADWPLVIPSLCSATAYLAWQALFWFIGPSGGLAGLLAVAGCASLAALGRLSTARPAVFERVALPQDWQQVPAIGIAVWLAVVGFAYLLAVKGVVRERRGDAWSLAWLGRGWLAATEAVSRRAESRRTGVRFRRGKPPSAEPSQTPRVAPAFASARPRRLSSGSSGGPRAAGCR